MFNTTYLCSPHVQKIIIITINTTITTIVIIHVHMN